MAENHGENLTKFNEINKEEIKGLDLKKFTDPGAASTPVQLLKEELRELVTQISQDANVAPYDWTLLKNYLVVTIKDSLFYMNTKYPDCENKSGDTFEEILGDLLDLFMLFEKEPPFTIQRICELILSPEANYKSSKKYCYAMERLLNVSPFLYN